MKKIWQFIIGLAAKPVLNEAGDFLHKALENYYAKNPKACAAMVAGLYPFIDTVVEDYAKSTSNEYDDMAVAEIKKDLEAFAAEKGFSLTNLDTDV